MQQYISSESDPDVTLVTPRFDEGETEMARPVVPLTSISPDGTAVTSASVRVATSPVRHSWPLAWILVSALIGSGIGVLALTLYQQHYRQTATPTVQLQPAPLFVPSSVHRVPARPATSPEPTPIAEVATQSPEQETNSAPVNQQVSTDTQKSNAGSGNTPFPASDKSPIESERDERKSQDKDRRKAQENVGENGEQNDRDEPRSRRPDPYRTSRPINPPAPQPEETERINRVRETVGNSRPRRVPPRSDSQPRAAGRIREIFEGP